MRNALKLAGCLALVVVPLSFGAPAYAQKTNNGPPSAQGQAGAGVWNGECPERQEFREERERIRAEHEQLESEHDMLKATCMDAKGQERSECAAKKADLHARVDALHERMKILHDKVEAEPSGCHHGQKGAGNKTPWPARQESPSSAPTSPQTLATPPANQ